MSWKNVEWMERMPRCSRKAMLLSVVITTFPSSNQRESCFVRVGDAPTAAELSGEVMVVWVQADSSRYRLIYADIPRCLVSVVPHLTDI